MVTIRNPDTDACPKRIIVKVYRQVQDTVFILANIIKLVYSTFKEWRNESLSNEITACVYFGDLG